MHNNNQNLTIGQVNPQNPIKFDFSYQKIIFKSSSLATGQPCKRCIYQGNIKQNYKTSINYICDVGMRSLLRSIRSFYELELSNFMKNKRLTFPYNNYMNVQQEKYSYLCLYVKEVICSTLANDSDSAQIIECLQGLLLAHHNHSFKNINYYMNSTSV